MVIVSHDAEFVRALEPDRALLMPDGTLDMFRDEWPAGHDTLLFGNIFHDWEDARCRKLALRAKVPVRQVVAAASAAALALLPKQRI